jgi:hypothetical protein
MAYSAFRVGDKVIWCDIVASVNSDSEEDNPKVQVICDGVLQTWYKVFGDIPVILEAVDAP